MAYRVIDLSSLMKLYRLLFLLCSLVLVAPGYALFAQGEATTVRFAPADGEAPGGQPFQVAVEVVDVTELYGFSVAFTFDPAVLQVQDSDPNLPGTQVGFGTFLEPGWSSLIAWTTSWAR